MPPQDVEVSRPKMLPLDVVSDSQISAKTQDTDHISAEAKVYSPERQRDNVRLIVACGFLTILGYLVVFSTIEAASYPEHWAQTQEMLQILLPALTGIIGTVIGFYFGTTAVGKNQSPDE